MSEPAPMMVEPINLEAFERMVYLIDGTPESFEAAARELFSLLGKIRRDSGFFGLGDPDRQLLTLYTRLAGAVSALFSNPRFLLSPDGFLTIAGQHVILHAIFRASAYENMDHVLGVIGSRDGEKISFTGTGQIQSLLLCWSLDSEVVVDFEAVARAAPDYVSAAILGMLAAGGTHSERSYANRLKLMSLRHLIADRPMHERMIQSAGDAYMHCSYTDAPDKHEIKRVLNGRIREMVSRSMTVPEVTTEIVRKERPTIVVPLEWFGSHHAMYRCYAPSLLQLKRRFRLVAICREKEIDEVGKAVFDKALAMSEEHISIAEIVGEIVNEAPDIIYYPSVGMAAWYVAVSNFRLAPIQVCSPGHPASTFSPVMDFIVSDGDLFGDPSCYTETLVALPVGSARYIARSGVEIPVKGASDGVFRIAVPAMAVKIIPPFLKVLQRIKAEARGPVEFHFFPNQVGTSHWVVTRDLKRWIPDAVVHPRTDYQQYLNNIVRCDLNLSTFPFGGTNSTIDSFLCGVPVLTLEGNQVHSKSDASMMRRMLLPDFLITHTVQEYVDTALACIHGDVHTKMPTAAEVEAEFYGDGPESVKDSFLSAFEFLYEERLNEQQRHLSRKAG